MTPDCRILDRSIHPFDLAVGPWVVGFGQTVIDLVLRAGQHKSMAAKEGFLGEQFPHFCSGPAIAPLDQ